MKNNQNNNKENNNNNGTLEGLTAVCLDAAVAHDFLDDIILATSRPSPLPQELRGDSSHHFSRITDGEKLPFFEVPPPSPPPLLLASEENQEQRRGETRFEMVVEIIDSVLDLLDQEDEDFFSASEQDTAAQQQLLLEINREKEKNNEIIFD